jgi:DNA replication protein DnaC
MLGDPACPICHGLGYYRIDLPPRHPEFGKVHVCTCRQSQITQQVRTRLFRLSHLDELAYLTFENFEPSGRIGLWPKQAESLQVAFNTAKQFAQSLNGWLLLMGGYGCGKTHLTAAIANFTVSMGVPTLFITVPDLLDSLRSAYGEVESSFQERLDEIRQAPLLILDDFGTQNATPWAQEKLFQIINYRYTNRLPLVVTTNLNLDQLEERIHSRLEDPDLVTTVRILASDYRNPTGDLGHNKLSTLYQHADQTFSTFDLRKKEAAATGKPNNLQKAFDKAYEYAQNPEGWLVFQGVPNTGKTHLAAAIGNYYAETHAPPLFVGVPDLLDHLRATFSPSSTISLDQRFEEVRTASFLILDDLGVQSTSPWAREKLYQLINYRYNAKLPTVFTSTVPLEDMDARIRSRMIDRRLCTVFLIEAPPYTGEAPENKNPPPTRKYTRTTTKQRS